MTPLEFALDLGLPCFPVLPDKRPACPHGFHDATADPGAIRDLWRRYPGRLVGVPTGDVSGIDALDIDSPRHPEGGTWLATKSIPPTRVHQTVSGGFHFLFQHHPGLKNSAGGRFRPGVDVRADGGYIVWWPCAGFAVLDKPLAPWPPELLRSLKPPKTMRSEDPPRADDHDIDRLARWVQRSAVGERNCRLYWAARQLASAQSPSGKIILISAAMSVGLPQPEAERTVNSAYRQDIPPHGVLR